MKNGVILLLTLTCAQAAWGQLAETSSIQHQYDSLAKSKSTKLDSASDRLNQKIDSAQLKINNALNPNLNNITQKLSLKRKPMDSVRAVQELDSMKGKLTNQIDSLRKLNLPTDRLTRKLDSLNKIGPTRYIQQTESKVNELQDKINQPVDNVESKINEKLTLMNKEGGADANIPGSANLPGADLNTNLNTGDKLNLPGTDLNAKNPLGEVENPLKDEMGEVSELKDKISDVKMFHKSRSIRSSQSMKFKAHRRNLVRRMS